MLRTILTIQPTLERLIISSLREDNNEICRYKVHLIVVSFYHEIEGYPTRKNIIGDDKIQIDQCEIDDVVTLEFVGFDSPS